MLHTTPAQWLHYSSDSSVARIDAEVIAAIALLSAAATVGAATVSDYGITADEFNANDYGIKALAWYVSGFRDRSVFDSVEDTLWYYGPWFHVLIAWVQSRVPANPWTVRHAMTFAVGILGIAALLPMGKLAFGRWAGLTAITLCLGTGYLYGSLFFTPIDVPFLSVMTWATLAIMIMARNIVPTWPATIAAGALSGLAIGTRSSGLITQAYLLGAVILCALATLRHPADVRARQLVSIGERTVCALAIGWLVAFVIWPWLQTGNPVENFKTAFLYFANHPNSFETRLWGHTVLTTDLPWFYVAGQLAARLPEAFLLLLLAGCAYSIADCAGLIEAFRCEGAGSAALRIRNVVLFVAESRVQLILWAGLLLPMAFIIADRSTLYDGVRHVLFVIPLLALVGGYGFGRILPVLTRFRLPVAALSGVYAGFTVWNLAELHPLEYMAMNSLAGGVPGAYGRFDLDYWAAAATLAVRRLEHRLDYEAPSGTVAARIPSITVCMGYREALVAPLLHRAWRIEVDPARADYVIATERWPCAERLRDLVLIDMVERFGRPFAWIYARRPPERDEGHAAHS